MEVLCVLELTPHVGEELATQAAEARLMLGAELLLRLGRLAANTSCQQIVSPLYSLPGKAGKAFPLYSLHRQGMVSGEIG